MAMLPIELVNLFFNFKIYNIMKQTLFLCSFLCLFLTSQKVSAQFSAGAGVAYGADLEDLGLQVKAIYQIADAWRAGADFIYYFDGIEGVSVSEINLNGHYLFKDDEQFQAYALAGFNFLSVNVDGFGGTSESGLNIGSGIGFPFSDTLTGVGEVKYTLGDASQVVVGAGVVFNF